MGPVVRTDIPRRQMGEGGDAYAHRLYTALAEGEIANGYRRKGESLQHVGDNLEYLDQFED